MKALGCLIFLALLAAFSHRSNASDGLCKWEGGPGTASACRSEDCPKDGGTALCTQVEIKMPDAGNNAEGYVYDMCDGSLYTSNDVKWCIAAGGTPGTGPDGGAGCDNLPPHVLGGMGTVVDEESLTRIIPDKKVGNPTCDQLTVVDSGWGKQPERDPGCWSFNPTAVNGINISDRRERTYSGHTRSEDATCSAPWSYTVVVRRDRKVGCPLGYVTRNRADGGVDCIRQPPCCTTRGDPVQMASGARLQREEDYQFGDPKGLRLTRYYYSFGFYRPILSGVSTTATVDDYWRNSYDIRLYKEPDGGLALATVVSPDGRITTFDLSGVPFQKYSGGGDRLRHNADGSWELLSAQGGGRKLFNAAGRLTALVDNNGLQTLVVYDGSGKMGLVEDPYGRQIVFSYIGDRLSSVTTPDGNSISYSYDTVGRLTSVTYADGANRSYKYENTQYTFLLTSITDELGVESEFSYDELGRAIQNSHKDGSVLETYSYYDGATSYTNALGKREVMSFATSGGVSRPTGTAVSCPGCASFVTEATFDANGNRGSSRDANGNLTTYVYDLTTNLEKSRTEALAQDGAMTRASRSVDTEWDVELRKATRVTHRAAGEPDWVESFKYDSKGNTLTSSLSSGDQLRSSSYTYDSEGRLIKVDGPRTDVQDITTITYFADNDACSGCRGQRSTVKDALGHITTLVAYDSNGRLTESKDPNGVVRKNTYDLRGRLKTSTLAFGLPAAEVHSYSYNLAGQLVKSISPDGVATEYGYDQLGSLASISAPSGSRVVIVRDNKGNILGQDSFDKDGVLRSRNRSVVDPLDRIATLIDAYGNRTNYIYDANGNEVSALSPMGSLSRVEYDEANRPVATTNPDGGQTSTRYDSRNNVLAFVDPLGHVTTYTYDGLGNRISATSPDTGVTTYEYDAAGNVVAMTDARGVRTVHTRDALGRVTSSRFGAGGADELFVEYSYDEGAGGIGHLTASKTPAAEVHLGYEPLGRIAFESQTTPAAHTTSYTYAQGHLTSLIYPSGMQVSYQYDGDGRVHDVNADGVPVMQNATFTSYGVLDSYTALGGQLVNRKHDLNGRVAAATMDMGNAGQPFAFSYQYDRNGRLTGASGGDAKTYLYSYDLNGNRISFAEDGVVWSYRYDDASNRLISLSISGRNTDSFSYDAKGSILSQGNSQFSYDARGNLRRSSVTSPLDYVTDGLGRRVSTSDGSSMLSYAYIDRYRILGTYSSPSGAADETIYVSGLPIAVAKKVGDSPRMLYTLLSDHTGTVREVTDASGRPMWIWGGEPFGASLPDEDPSGLGHFVNRQRFPGQLFDIDSGLSYNIHRDYDSRLGRYLESDPLGLQSGPNTYGYADADPINNVDPLGLVKWNVGVFTIGGKIPGVRLPPLGTGTFQASSECVNGRMGFVDGVIAFTDGGAGLPFGFSGSNATLEDGMPDLDLYALDGAYVSLGVNVLFGAGPSYSAMRMGKGVSNPGFSFDGGLTFGTSAVFGDARVLHTNLYDCGCESGK